MTPSMR